MDDGVNETGQERKVSVMIIICLRKLNQFQDVDWKEAFKSLDVITRSQLKCQLRSFTGKPVISVKTVERHSLHPIVHTIHHIHPKQYWILLISHTI